MVKALQLDRTNGRFKEVDIDAGGAAQLPTTESKSIPLFISGNFVQAGDSVTLFMPNGARIDGVVLHTDAAATIAIDVRAVAPEDLPSDVADSICGATPPVLSGANFVSDNVLDGWLKMVPENRVIVARVTSVTGNVRHITLQLNVVTSVDGLPLVWFTAPEAAGFYAYVVPALIFASATVDEYPTYTHVDGTSVIPMLRVAATSVEEFPIYVQAETALVFNAPASWVATQWEKVSLQAVPSNGATPYSYAVTGLPAGLSYGGTYELAVSGVPEVSGVFTITIEVTDSKGRVTSDTVELTVTVGTRTPAVEAVFPGFLGSSLPASVRGYNFGAAAGVLLLGGVDYTANVTAWSETEIEFTVPSGLSSPCAVQVTAYGQISTAVNCAVVTA